MNSQTKKGRDIVPMDRYVCVFDMSYLADMINSSLNYMLWRDEV